jgi:hypothetical protein
MQFICADGLWFNSTKHGFFGAQPATKPSALTAGLSALTVGGTVFVDDYTLNETNSSPWGFNSQDEIRTFMRVVENNRARIAELETRLQNIGLLS